MLPAAQVSAEEETIPDYHMREGIPRAAPVMQGHFDLFFRGWMWEEAGATEAGALDHLEAGLEAGIAHRLSVGAFYGSLDPSGGSVLFHPLLNGAEEVDRWGGYVKLALTDYPEDGDLYEIVEEKRQVERIVEEEVPVDEAGNAVAWPEGQSATAENPLPPGAVGTKKVQNKVTDEIGVPVRRMKVPEAMKLENLLSVGVTYTGYGMDSALDSDFSDASLFLVFTTRPEPRIAVHTLFETGRYFGDIDSGNRNRIGVGADYRVGPKMILEGNGGIEIFSGRKPDFRVNRVTRFDVGLVYLVNPQLKFRLGGGVVSESVSEDSAAVFQYGVNYVF
jgi:hypothetical protein